MGYIRLLWDLYQLKKNVGKSESRIKEIQGKKLRKLLVGRPRILYIAATDGRYVGAMAVGDGIDGVGGGEHRRADSGKRQD